MSGLEFACQFGYPGGFELAATFQSGEGVTALFGQSGHSGQDDDPQPGRWPVAAERRANCARRAGAGRFRRRPVASSRAAADRRRVSGATAVSTFERAGESAVRRAPPGGRASSKIRAGPSCGATRNRTTAGSRPGRAQRRAAAARGDRTGVAPGARIAADGRAARWIGRRAQASAS